MGWPLGGSLFCFSQLAEIKCVLRKPYLDSDAFIPWKYLLMHFPSRPAKNGCQPAQYFSGGCLPEGPADFPHSGTQGVVRSPELWGLAVRTQV